MSTGHYPHHAGTGTFLDDVPLAHGLLRLLLFVQGGYYLATGVWPLVSPATFELVTGPKTDFWLVQTLGALIAVVGVVLLGCVLRRQPSLEAGLLAVGCAVALGAVDVTFVSRGVIGPVYLLDALAEGLLVVGWCLTVLAGGRHAPAHR